MGKKIRYKLLKGSLKQPIFQFTNKLQFNVNPLTDPQGTAMANYWYTISKNTKPKFKAQNFDSSINYDFRTSSSYVTMNFVNGWKKGFFFKNKSNVQFDNEMNITNRLVEYERALQGYDDQYEDED